MASEAALQPHVGVFPCSGMGHLIPFLRLAAELHSRGCAVTIIAVEPSVSAAEADHLSKFLTTFPRIKRVGFRILPREKSQEDADEPFFRQMERIGNSVHLLQPQLSSLSPSLSAIFADLPVLTRVTALPLSIPTYTLIVTSARFFSLMASLSDLRLNSSNAESVEVPGLGPILLSSIPPVMLDPSHLFASIIIANISSLPKTKGVLINTFDWLEPKAIAALRGNILPIGPLKAFETGEGSHDLNLPWLDAQAPESVIYISFGSKATHTREQIREVAAALELSGCKFVWALKGSKVDREDKEEVEEMLGGEFLEKTKDKGLVVKGWVEQAEVLAHPAIGGFVSHCGWNSVTEAAELGVPILGWPPGGDQRVNAEVMEEIGLGVWVRDWGWSGERLVGRDEIAASLKAFVGDGKLRARAKEVKEKVRQSRESDGSSERLLQQLIHSFNAK